GTNSSAVISTPTIDPRLVVHARTQTVSGSLDGSLPLSGTIYPTLPGTNTITLQAAPGTRTRDGEQMRLVLTMPGMTMTPVHATLTARDHKYTGRVYIPMFGFYLAK